MTNDSGKKFGVWKAFAVVVVLLIAAVIALPFIIDANQFKPQLEAKLWDSLGRKVTVGKLKLSIFSGSIAVDAISIADNPDFSSTPFIQAKALQAGVEMKPLILSKAIHISSISLDNPAISLIRSVSGKWNFSDLGSQKGTKTAETESKKTSADPQKTDVVIKQLKIANGKITLRRGASLRKFTTYENVNISASNLSLTSSFPISLSASLPHGGNFNMKGNAGPINQADALQTPLFADFDVSKLNLIASGFMTPDSGIAGIIDFKGNLNSDGRIVKSKGIASADKFKLNKIGSPAVRPISLAYSIQYNLKSQSGIIDDATVSFGKAAARLTGSFNSQGDSTALKMRVHGANMPLQDLKTLLPAFGMTLPKGASLNGGSLTADLAAEGPIEKMVIAGTVDIAKVMLSGFDLAGKMAVIASFAGIQSNTETEIEKLASNLKMTPEGIQATDIQLIVPALGEMTGGGTIASDQSLDFKMKAMLKPAGGLGGSIIRLLKKDGVLEVPFSVRGTAAEPKFVPDMKKAADNLFGASLKKNDLKEEEKKPALTLGNVLRDLLKKKKE